MVNKLKVSKQSSSDESKATVGWHPTRVRPLPALQPRWYPQNHQIGEVWQWEMPKRRFFLIKFVIYTKCRTSVYTYICCIDNHHISYVIYHISYNIEYRISYWSVKKSQTSVTEHLSIQIFIQLPEVRYYQRNNALCSFYLKTSCHAIPSFCTCIQHHTIALQIWRRRSWGLSRFKNHLQRDHQDISL